MSDSRSELTSPEDVAEVVPDSVEPLDTPLPAPSRHPPPPPRLRERVASQHARPIHVDVDAEPRVASELMTRESLTIGPDDPLAPLDTQLRAFPFGHLP